MDAGKGNRNENERVVVGRNAVFEMLRQRGADVQKLFLQAGAGGGVIRDIASAAAEAGVRVQYVPKRRLDRLAPDAVHQGVIAMVGSFRYATVEELIQGLGGSIDVVKESRPMVLVLDRIQDVHNFGAILRTAAAGGIDGVLVPATHMAPLSAAAVKASAGTAGLIPIARTARLAVALTQLKEVGFWVVGLDTRGDKSIWDTRWDRPTALVIGGEAEGISASVRKACDEFAAIPMSGGVESLNASVAAAVTIFAAAHVRHDQAR